MKKIIAILVSMLLLTTILSACSAQTNEKNTPSPTQSEELQTSTSTKNPSTASPRKSLLDLNDLTFDDATKNYFNGDVAAALTKMEPLLLSAVRAEYSYKKLFISSGDALDSDISWAVVYNLLNSYGYTNSLITTKSDGSLVVQPEGMKEVFITTFANFSGAQGLPKLSKDFSGMITLDKDGIYNISRSDAPELKFTLKNISLSKANSAVDPTQSATLTIELLDDDKLFNVDVEIVHDDHSYFDYSIQSIDRSAEAEPINE